MDAAPLLRRLWIVASAIAVISACTQPAPKPVDPGPPLPAPVRFLITFDDGPSTWEPYNPTRVILDQLLDNPVQPEIKAIFFVQTRDRRAGGGPAGQALLRRANSEGHVLALHTATPGRAYQPHLAVGRGIRSIPARGHGEHPAHHRDAPHTGAAAVLVVR